MDRDKFRELLKAAVQNHGMDPNDPEIAESIEFVLRTTYRVDMTPLCPLCSSPPAMTIGDTALCGTPDCKTVFWDRSKTMDELLMNMGLVDLRSAFDDRPDS